MQDSETAQVIIKREYEHRNVIDILDGYELWTQHISEKETDGDRTNI